MPTPMSKTDPWAGDSFLFFCEEHDYIYLSNSMHFIANNVAYNYGNNCFCLIWPILKKNSFKPYVVHNAPRYPTVLSKNLAASAFWAGNIQFWRFLYANWYVCFFYIWKNIPEKNLKIPHSWQVPKIIWNFTSARKVQYFNKWNFTLYDL